MRSYAKSIALYERTRKTLAGGVSSNVRYAATPVPLFFERGEGARLYDVDGNVHIDYVLGNGPAILGHAPKPVIDAVAATLGEGQVFAAQHPRETELAERLVRLLPSSEVVRFATSGTEAVLMAFRLARAFTGRDQDPEVRGPLSRLERPGLYQRPAAAQRSRTRRCTRAGRGIARHAASVLDDVVVAAGTTRPARRGLRAQQERDRRRHHGAGDGERRTDRAAPGYLEGVRDLCRPNGALFICDEVITGFRAGLRGAQGRYGVRPTSRSTPRRSPRAFRSPWSAAGATSWTRCSTRASCMAAPTMATSRAWPRQLPRSTCWRRATARSIVTSSVAGRV